MHRHTRMKLPKSNVGFKPKCVEVTKVKMSKWISRQRQKVGPSQEIMKLPKSKCCGLKPKRVDRQLQVHLGNKCVSSML